MYKTITEPKEEVNFVSTELRTSDSGSFYYLLGIDELDNEFVLIESDDIQEIYKHSKLKGKKPKPIREKDTRGRQQ